MAKRKKNRAKPAAESQTNVADAEVRPEIETVGEVPAGETEGTDTAQAEPAVEAQAEEASEAQATPRESTDEPSSEASPEDGEAVAERTEEALVSEPTEVLEDSGEVAEAAAEQGAAEEEVAAAEAVEGASEEDAVAAEAAAEEGAAEESAEAAEAVEGATEEEAATAEAVAEEGAAEESAEAAAEEAVAPAEATVESVSAAEAEAEAVWAEDRVAALEGEAAPAEAGEQDSSVWTESAEGGEAAPAGEGEAAPTGEDGEETPAILDSTLMESVIEGLLFASDRVLGMADFKRLLEERDGKKIAAALESLAERRKGTGIEVVHLSNGWHLRTNSEHARWVSKLLAGKPMRLSRAMMETLAIVAYRQPVTRPEIDEIRGVDCGPVLKTLLDRGLVRVIGKKEDVGRPMLYGTTPEFLRVFNLRELSELPTLREYAELNSEQQAVVDAKHGPGPDAPASPAAPAEGQAEGGEGAAPAPSVDVSAGPQLKFVPRGQLPDEPEDSDPLLDELDAATKDASKILGAANEPPPEAAAEAEASAPAPAEPSHET